MDWSKDENLVTKKTFGHKACIIETLLSEFEMKHAISALQITAQYDVPEYVSGQCGQCGQNVVREWSIHVSMIAVT